MTDWYEEYKNRVFVSISNDYKNTEEKFNHLDSIKEEILRAIEYNRSQDVIENLVAKYYTYKRTI